MNNTGRIQQPPHPYVRRILFGRTVSSAEMVESVEVDKAHIVMLAEQNLVPQQKAARLLQAIERLVEEDFRPLRAIEPTRGAYLQYEDYLIQSEGAEVGGILQTARSRNDLNATVIKLRLRRPCARAVVASLRLLLHLLRQSNKYADMLMPAFTHGQPATPGSFGHYLAGVAAAIGRDIRGLLDAMHDLDNSPLGAGAVTGSHLPIDTERTAELLGFRRGPLHSQDAVASRDFVLRILAALAIGGITLSRIASDLLRWSGPEYDFLRFPDHLVGSSSAMPQKRNPFLLEHVIGRATSVLGAFVSGANAMHAAPFTNCIAVATEAPRPLWQAIEDYVEAVELLRLVIVGVVVNRAGMRRAAENGFIIAQALASEIARSNGLDFRAAHHAVGESITSAMQFGEHNCIDADQVLRNLDARGLHFPSYITDPGAIMNASEWGGGPGPRSLFSSLAACRSDWKEYRSRLLEQRLHWKIAKRRLSQAVKNACAPALQKAVVQLP